MRFIGFIAIVLLTVGGAVDLRYGTLQPCGILRVQMREQAARGGGPDAFLVTAMPDSLLDAMIAAQYGPLTPATCLSMITGQENRRPAFSRR